MTEKFIPMDPELVADGLSILNAGQAKYLRFGEGMTDTTRLITVVESTEDAAYYAMIRAGFEPLEIVDRGEFKHRLARAIGRRAAKNSVSSVDQRG